MLQLSKIIPIKKSPELDDTDPKSYRPINLLSPLSKLTEKIWTEQIYSHLVSNGLLAENIQGSVRGRDSTTTIIEIHQQLVRARAEGRVAAIVAMDQSAAYDVIDHAILKRKLLHIGIDATSVDLLMNYLTSRKQQVSNNSSLSEVLLTGECSVSQGSVLSGLLYIIYTLDMHDQLHPIKHSNNTEYYKCSNTYSKEALCTNCNNAY